MPHLCFQPLEVPHLCFQPLEVRHLCFQPLEVRHLCFQPQEVWHLCFQLLDVPHFRNNRFDCVQFHIKGQCFVLWTSGTTDWVTRFHSLQTEGHWPLFCLFYNTLSDGLVINVCRMRNIRKVVPFFWDTFLYIKHCNVLFVNIFILSVIYRSTRWCNWLRHCTTNLKVAGSIPYGVSGIFNLPWDRLIL